MDADEHLNPPAIMPSKEAINAALENPEFIYVTLDSTWAKRDVTGEMMEGGFRLAWGVKNLGFGQIEFHQSGLDRDSLKVECRSERMGPEFVKKAVEHFMKGVQILE